MCGRAYSPRFLWMWPNARVGVMGADQLAAVMETVGKPDPELRDRIERESDAVFSSARLWDDGVIPPEHTRRYLGLGLAAALSGRNDVKPGATKFEAARRPRSPIPRPYHGASGEAEADIAEISESLVADIVVLTVASSGAAPLSYPFADTKVASFFLRRVASSLLDAELLSDPVRPPLVARDRDIGRRPSQESQIPSKITVTGAHALVSLVAVRVKRHPEKRLGFGYSVVNAKLLHQASGHIGNNA
ncbi:methylcrotonoyl-CoA carboxylase subunit beta [Magnaporthiopsis poae ATCC 64411]|uniref:Methylcrotonoyl-CoA carboxylase subunit beta n=1 Tax=Magnaporthiopsis poae (strain ATCC 64411 / 73-15) TaxID=644358 RepID=A0A0C4DQJ6_MAGP6|nr:methylcrotonoyl-CoA carboxylase subunit beta [Magnaporthiopsis poae ATCC 64411]